MIKNSWLLAGFIFLLSVFTACSDDDKHNQSATYTGENLQLKVNNQSTILGIVIIENRSESKALITLLGIIPDDISLSMEVDLIQNGETTKLQGNLKKDFFETEIEGSLTGNLLTLNVTYLNTSALVGSWNYSDTYVKIDSANGIIIEEGSDLVEAARVTAMVKAMVEPYILGLQTLILKEEGMSSAKYISSAGETGIAENFASYFVTGSTIHFIPDAGFLLNLITKSAEPSVLSSLAIKYRLVENGVIFYIDKEFLSTAGTILSYLNSLLEDKPAILENYIEPILTIATQANTFELGVYLEK